MLEVLTGPVQLLALAIFSIAALVVYVYLYAQAKPLPGIPRRSTTGRILGDIPALVKGRAAEGEALVWLTKQCHELDSPIVQLFLGTFAKFPLVVVNDFRETEDVALRRFAQFDVAPRTCDLFSTIVPNGTISMPSHDRFKAQRRLWSGTMSTEFLHSIVSPRIYDAGMELVQLWRTKIDLAHGGAFQANQDLRHCALDAIWAAAVGSSLGGLAAQQSVLSSPASRFIQQDANGAAQFLDFSLPPVFKAIEQMLTTVSDIAAGGLKPKLAAWYHNTFSSAYREASRVKTETMHRLLHEARKRYSNQSDQTPTCAMEQVLSREAAEIKKQGSSAILSDDAMIDELFIWLVAGHETTATTLAWGLKHLAGAPEFQKQLRRDITATIGGPLESAKQILDADIPLLDATAWEMLRLARTAAGIMRVAAVDTELLGYHIPKGVQIIFSTSGFTVLDEKEYTVNDTSRSAGSRSAGKVASWDLSTKTGFMPSRWLREVDGKVTFDIKAGPHLPFGGGPRGCFGRKLAMIELKVFIAQLVLEFDFLPVGAELSNWESKERITRQPLQCFIRPWAVKA